MNKVDKKEDYRDYFQSKESANKYDEVAYQNGTYESLLWGIEKEILKKHFLFLRNTNKRLRYLDFACGTGRIVSAVEDLVDESYGLDISQPMLDRAEQKTKHSILVQGDITQNENIIKGSFDIITTFRFILNANPELRDMALGILTNKLESKDSLLVFNMHTNKYSYAFVSYLWYLIWGQSKYKDTKRYMSLNDCKRIAKKANLEIVKIKGLGFLSKKIFSFIPIPLSHFIEENLSKIPYVNLLGTDLIFFCKKITNNKL